MRRTAAGLAAAIGAIGGFGAAAPPATEVVLAPTPVVSDAAPDARLDATALVATLREGVAATPGFRLVTLGPDRLLSPDDRVVAVVPVVTTARISRERRADAVVEVTAYVGGGLQVLDPWTDTVLHATSRLVSAPVRVAVGEPGREDEGVREAFRRALARWTEESLDQLRRNVSPFVVSGLTGTVPSPARKTRGLWLRGRAHGVHAGMVARSDDGRLVRVESASERFSTVRDVADPAAPVPAGMRLRAIAVADPARRPEPVLRLEWLGGEDEGLPAGSGLSGETLVDVVQNYVARDGGLRVTAPAGGLGRSAAFRELSELVSRHAKLLSGASGMTLHRETALRIAEEEPDLVAGVGVVDTYHGTRTLADGRVQHLYRATLVASVEVPLPEGGRAVARAFTTTEEQAAVEMTNVRELRPEDLWFTTLRNACVRLAGSLRSAALGAAGNRAGRTLAGRVGPGGEVSWPEGAPGPHAPLAWLRPAGTVTDERGAPLPEPLLERVEPSRGFLNLASLAGETTEPGDVLEFRPASAEQPRSADLVVRLPEPPPARALGRDVVARLAADRLVATRLVAPRFVGPEGAAPGRLALELVVGAPTVGESLAATRLAGEWRLRLWPDGLPSEGEPSLKAGIAYVEERRYEAGRPLLSPPDRGSELAAFRDGALDRLVSSFVEKGFARAAGARSRAAEDRRSE